MDKYVWYVITSCIDGKRYAHAFRLRMNQNIASFVKDYKGIESMNACETKKIAVTTAEAWNKSFKANGTYMFDNETF